MYHTQLYVADNELGYPELHEIEGAVAVAVAVVVGIKKRKLTRRLDAVAAVPITLAIDPSLSAHTDVDLLALEARDCAQAIYTL